MEKTMIETGTSFAAVASTLLGGATPAFRERIVPEAILPLREDRPRT